MLDGQRAEERGGGPPSIFDSEDAVSRGLVNVRAEKEGEGSTRSRGLEAMVVRPASAQKTQAGSGLYL